MLSSARWSGLWQSASGAGQGSAWFEKVAAHYAEPHRHYHTAQHISECLAEFDGARSLASQPAAVEFALWFHDVIYDTRRSDNEEQSAAFAEACLLEAGAPPDLIESVRDLVLATKTHDSSVHRDAPLLVDIDLSILGTDSHRFREYEEQIRREYAWVPQDVFNTKRSEILELFLSRKSIYATDRFQRSHEKQARTNLETSLKQLRG